MAAQNHLLDATLSGIPNEVEHQCGRDSSEVVDSVVPLTDARPHKALHELALEKNEPDQQWRGCHQRGGTDD